MLDQTLTPALSTTRQGDALRAMPVGGVFLGQSTCLLRSTASLLGTLPGDMAEAPPGQLVRPLSALSTLTLMQIL